MTNNIRIILVRHGVKESNEDNLYADWQIPLSQNGHEATDILGNCLAKLKLGKTITLTSHFHHSLQTAEKLKQWIISDAPRPIDTLTPGSRHAPSGPKANPEFSIESMISQANLETLTGDYTIIIVGHEPRLTQLATMLTSERFPPLDHLEALCIEAANLHDLRVGCGKLKWRWSPPRRVKVPGKDGGSSRNPVADASKDEKWTWTSPRPVADASKEDLGPKLTGKMTIAALLAGFNFAALLELVKEPDSLHLEKLTTWDWSLHWGTIRDWHGILDVRLWSTMRIEKVPVFAILSMLAILFLTLSMGLFVIAIYIYDRLSMPRNFLESNPEWPRLAVLRSKTMNDRVERFGLVYAAMIYTWHKVFTRAVCLAVLGIICIVARVSFFIAAGTMLLILLIGGYYWLVKPRYSVD